MNLGRASCAHLYYTSNTLLYWNCLLMSYFLHRTISFLKAVAMTMPHLFWKLQFLTGLSDSCCPPLMHFSHCCGNRLAKMQSPPVTPLPQTLQLFPVTIKIKIFKTRHELDPAYLSTMPFYHLHFILYLFHKYLSIFLPWARHWEHNLNMVPILTELTFFPFSAG